MTTTTPKPRLAHQRPALALRRARVFGPRLVLLGALALAGSGAAAQPGGPAGACAPGSPWADCGSATTGTAMPPGPVSLQQALAAAVCRGGRLKQNQGLSLQAQADLDRARALLWPEISLSAGLSQSRGEPAQREASLRLDWLLLDFGATGATIQAAREAALAVLRDREADLLLALAAASDAYVAALAAFGRLEAAAVNLQTAQEGVRVAQARQEAGAATVADRLQAETAAGQSRLEFGRARTAWQLARGELAQAMDLPINAELQLAPMEALATPPADSALNLQALIDEAQARHPAVRAAQARREQARATAEAARAQRWGSVNLGARANTDSGSGGFTGTAGASLAWRLPLMDGGSLRAREQGTQGQILLREADLDASLRQVALQVWQAGQTLAGEQRNLQAAGLVLRSAEAALQATTERYRLGVGGFGEVVNAFNAMAASRLQWAEARANVARAALRLAAATGRFGGL